jgi:heat shock protein HslJ
MSSRRTAIIVALTVLATLLSVLPAAAGCGSPPGSNAPGGPSAGRHVLDGSAWRLVTWRVSSPDPARFAITARFAHGRIGGHSGVNHYGGPYRATADGRFALGELAVTAMGSTGPNMTAEAAYLKLLGEARSFTRSGARLTLLDRHGAALLAFRK